MCLKTKCSSTGKLHLPRFQLGLKTQTLLPFRSQQPQTKPTFVMTESLPSTGVLHQINWYGTSSYGVPFAVVSIIDAANNIHRALASSRRFGDLSRLSEFVGWRVNLVATPNGLQLKPIADQISPEQQLEEDGHLEGMDEHVGPPVDAASHIHVGAASYEAVDPAAEAISVDKLQEVAATVAKLARDLRLPTCMWIHLP
jgi:hypothetical protein